MLTLFSLPRTRGFRVTWMLEELGLEYQFHKIDLLKGEGRSPEYLALNPGGKVPALRDDDLVISESAAIVAYLGDKYGDSGLVPEAGTAKRARYDQWCYFVMAELEQGLWTMAKHNFALPESQRVPQVIETGRWEFYRALKVLEAGLDNQEYILGKAFSAADILIVHTLNWAKGVECELSAELENYLTRCTDRPAFQRAKQREIEEAKK